MPVQALYVHVPFCHAKCLYCDFDSRPCRDASAYDVYAETAVSRIGRLADAGILDACATAYIGGGTPTVLGDRLVRIVSAIRDAMPHLVELTCEANPESLTSDLAYELRRAGATRLSVGVQSFADDELRALGRLHDARRAYDAVSWGIDAGLAVSVDLMCGTPGQTRESWCRSLRRAIESGAGHVSVYPLTIEEGTPFWSRVERGELAEPDGDLQAELMEDARTTLSAAGLEPYEVASYARADCACRHNIAYWTGVSYLGIGRSAASMLDRATYDALAGPLRLPAVADAAQRVRFVQVHDAFIGPDGCADIDREELDAREAIGEDLMLGMRMTRGVGKDLLARACRVIGEHAVRTAVDEAVSRRLARWDADAGRLVPTHDGWLLGNELYGLFWDLAR